MRPLPHRACVIARQQAAAHEHAQQPPAIGLCVATCLRYFGASEVIVIETNAHRLGVAAKLGCTTINGATEDVRARVRELTGGANADFAGLVGRLPFLTRLPQSRPAYTPAR